MSIELYHGNCIPIMAGLPDRSFDAIIADLPYGTTACKWDTVIPFEPLWEQYKRLIKKRGAIVLFGSQPFTSALVMSNVEWFKYEIVWRKSHSTGHLGCKVQPLKQHENISVFGNGAICYNPQLSKKPEKDVRPSRKSAAKTSCYGKYENDAETTIPLDMSYPRTVIDFNSPNHGEKGLHPTQKPIALLEYLIRTYTNPGDHVLDNTMGSGTTMVACVHTGRSGTGIEMDKGYFEIAQGRVEKAQSELIQLSF